MKGLTAYIIAAGKGERLENENCEYKKAMIPIFGVPMIGRLIYMLCETGFRTIRVITNEANSDVAEYIEQVAGEMTACDVDVLLKSTPSSMHSLYELLSYKNCEEFFLFTVDTIFHQVQLQNYVEHCIDSNHNFDAIIAVTEYIDDEKPLFVRTNGDEITAFLDTREDCTRVTSGMYYFDEDVLPALSGLIESGATKLRNFQRSLLQNGMRVGYFNFDKTIDLDHVGDIEKAEAFLKNSDKKI